MKGTVATDIDKLPALRDYIKTNLLPKIAAGNLNAFTSDSLKTFGARMQATVEPP